VGAVIELNYWKANAVNAANYTKAESDGLFATKYAAATGLNSYETLALLPTTGTANVSYKVTNDSTVSNNGYYHWNGSIYVQDYNLVNGVIASGNVEAVSGDKIKTALDKKFGYNTVDIVNLFPDPQFLTNKHVVLRGIDTYEVINNKLEIDYPETPPNVWFDFIEGYRYTNAFNYTNKINVNFKLKSLNAGTVRLIFRNNREQASKIKDETYTFIANEEKIISNFITMPSPSNSFTIQISISGTSLPSGKLSISDFLISVDNINHDFINIGDVVIKSTLKEEIKTKTAPSKRINNLFGGGDFKNPLWENLQSPSYTSISYLENKVNVKWNEFSDVGPANSLLKLHNSQKIAIITDFTIINETAASNFKIDILKYKSSEYMANLNYLEYNGVGIRTIDIQIVDVIDLPAIPTINDSQLVFSNPNTTSLDVDFHKILVLDLGYAGDDFYGLTIDEIKEYYKTVGYFEQLDFVNYAENVISSSAYKSQRMLTFGHSQVYQNTWQPKLASLLGTVYDYSETYPSNDYDYPLALGASHIAPYYTDSTPYDITVDGANASNKKNASMHYRAKQIVDFEGLLVVMNAQNDSYSSSIFGSIEDSGYIGDEVLAVNSSGSAVPSLYASIKGMLQILSSNNPKAKIVYCSIYRSWQYDPSDEVESEFGIGSNKYNQFIVEKNSCERLGVTFVDLWNDSGINAYNASEYLKADSDYEDWKNNGGSRVHSNEQGGIRIAETIYAKIS